MKHFISATWSTPLRLCYGAKYFVNKEHFLVFPSLQVWGERWTERGRGEGGGRNKNMRGEGERGREGKEKGRREREEGD